ncbi:c-type cytochrome domain-containing protein, partial [Arenibacter certesii]|uniref:c-type cytochrome domain-containing protein n=1 Tax=Arenibacter certesii TaxID=228955 RepID=UPI00167AA648
MAIIKNILIYTGFLLVLSCGGPQLPELVSLEYDKIPNQVDFNIHVKPILSDKCFICHGPDKAKIKANLQLDTPEEAYKELRESPGKYALTPGNLNRSEVFH